MTREGSRCPFTGRVDHLQVPEADDEDVLTDVVNVAHIISQSFSEGIEGRSKAAREKVRPVYPKRPMS